MEEKKYELMDETIQVDGHTLHRIKALQTIIEHGILKGDLGGYGWHKGDTWIAVEVDSEDIITVQGRKARCKKVKVIGEVNPDAG